ncbi:MAG: hypothetical protein ACREQN_16780 [Candidatus Binataceae bacterium]
MKFKRALTIAVAVMCLMAAIVPNSPQAAQNRPTVIRLVNQSARITDFDLAWMSGALNVQLNRDFRHYYHVKQPILVVACTRADMDTQVIRKASGCQHGMPVYLRDINPAGTWEGRNVSHAYAVVQVQGMWNGDITTPALAFTTEIADHEIMSMLTGAVNGLDICDKYEIFFYFVAGLRMEDFALPHRIVKNNGTPDFCSTQPWGTCWR